MLMLLACCSSKHMGGQIGVKAATTSILKTRASSPTRWPDAAKAQNAQSLAPELTAHELIILSQSLVDL